MWNLWDRVSELSYHFVIWQVVHQQCCKDAWKIAEWLEKWTLILHFVISHNKILPYHCGISNFNGKWFMAFIADIFFFFFVNQVWMKVIKTVMTLPACKERTCLFCNSDISEYGTFIERWVIQARGGQGGGVKVGVWLWFFSYITFRSMDKMFSISKTTTDTLLSHLNFLVDEIHCVSS